MTMLNIQVYGLDKAEFLNFCRAHDCTNCPCNDGPNLYCFGNWLELPTEEREEK